MPVQTPCGHVFCDRCVRSWVRVSATCPCCRRPIERVMTHVHWKDKSPPREEKREVPLAKRQKRATLSVLCDETMSQFKTVASTYHILDSLRRAFVRVMLRPSLQSRPSVIFVSHEALINDTVRVLREECKLPNIVVEDVVAFQRRARTSSSASPWVMVATHRNNAGWDLAECANIVMLGKPLDFANDTQARGRLDRLSQSNRDVEAHIILIEGSFHHFVHKVQTCNHTSVGKGVNTLAYFRMFLYLDPSSVFRKAYADGNTDLPDAIRSVFSDRLFCRDPVDFGTVKTRYNGGSCTVLHDNGVYYRLNQHGSKRSVSSRKEMVNLDGSTNHKSAFRREVLNHTVQHLRNGFRIPLEPTSAFQAVLKGDNALTRYLTVEKLGFDHVQKFKAGMRSFISSRRVNMDRVEEALFAVAREWSTCRYCKDMNMTATVDATVTRTVRLQCVGCMDVRREPMSDHMARFFTG